MMFSPEDTSQWTPIIAKSLARIALHLAELDDKSISDRAAFLQGLGLDKDEIAPMLGTTPASVAELLRLRGKKGDQNGQGQKSSVNKKRAK
jgi:hypothetical protein